MDRVSPAVTSAQIVVAPENADFRMEADQRQALYRDLASRAAEHAVIDLGALRSSELERLSDANQAESRRFLVGIDRVVDQEVDLALGCRGSADRRHTHRSHLAGVDDHPAFRRAPPPSARI